MPNPSARSDPGQLQLLTRPDCGLCEQFALELAELARHEALPPIVLVDIDEHPELARRHGLDIPVLLWDGVRIGQHRFDRHEVLRLLRPRQAPSPL